MGKKTRSAKIRMKAGKYETPSPQEVIEKMSAAGGWTAVQLAAWGIAWPPKKGWRDELRRRWQSVPPTDIPHE